MRKFVIILAVLAIIIGALAWFIWPRNEPRYQGGRISFWIDYPGYDVSRIGYFPAADSNAIPYLVKALNRKTEPLRAIHDAIYNASPAFARKHLRAPRKFTDWYVRASAAQVLGRIGTNSPPAIAGLIGVLKHEKNPVVKVYAVEALENIGRGNTAVEKTIVEALHDPAPEVRDAAEDTLRQLDPEAAKRLIK